ncbi:MAG: UDP-N-acetylmuramate dehydrogenase [Oscillospiraceae bacterium]|jgi:UDP-N-acetylmuramate dehydrogenase
MIDLSFLANDIRKKLPALELREDEPMRKHCSFRIGGPAAIWCQPGSIAELQELCTLLREKGAEPLVIGNGTNLLVTDEALRRVVIQTTGIAGAKRTSETTVYVEAGMSLARAATLCASYGLTGMEFAQGIPGTVGGGTSMNAGAYGGEMKQVLRSAAFLDENMKIGVKAGQELDLSYRHSAFSDTAYIVLGCELRLKRGDAREIDLRMRELAEKRRAKQPLELPSAGSTFKRPENGFAAALIEQCGLKGCCRGGAQVSEKHAGFIVNRGGASFEDVRSLMAHVQETVFAQTGVRLEPEVKIIENV